MITKFKIFESLSSSTRRDDFKVKKGEYVYCASLPSYGFFTLIKGRKYKVLDCDKRNITIENSSGNKHSFSKRYFMPEEEYFAKKYNI